MSPLAVQGLPQNTIPIHISNPQDNLIPTINPALSSPHDISIPLEEELYDWKHRDLLKENNIRAAIGTVTSTFIVHLKPISELAMNITKNTFDTYKKLKEFHGNHEENAILKAAQAKAQGLQNLLQTVCSPTSSTNKRRQNKRFVSFIIFFVLTSIAAYGISKAVANSSRLITKQDIQIANTTAEERFLLSKLEIKRLQKDSKRIGSLEERIDKIEFNDAVDELSRKYEQTVENEKRELQLILAPDSYDFEESNFMQQMAFDIRSYFAATNNDLFEHVYGSGITEVLYFTTFQTVALRDGNSDACEDGYVMIVATTIIPNTNIIGTATEDPQKYKTQDGRFLYIGKDFIPDGTTFRPTKSLSSQRLVLTSGEISVSILNNTVFMVENNGLHLDINITCPGKNVTHETLFNNPFLKLQTSCEVSSTHLNISTFTQEYQQDEIAVELNLFENIDEESHYVIGYHRTPIQNNKDIGEMYAKAHDIFIKETEILQHQMKKLEGDFSFVKELEKAGTVVSGWFNQSLHTIVGAIVGILIFIGVILFLVAVSKCCSFYVKKKN